MNLAYVLIELINGILPWKVRQTSLTLNLAMLDKI